MRARLSAPYAVAAPLLLALCAGAAYRYLPAPGTKAVRAAAAQTAFSGLISGGGPSRAYNQVAIESNVRYVTRLFPANAPLTILFADGPHGAANVQYTTPRGHTRYRRSTLPRIDGPTQPSTFDTSLSALAHPNSVPLLLYFTGHGSPDGDGTYRNNEYDMWGNATLSVADLRGKLDRLPLEKPVTLVMVQCFSGAFADLVFAAAPKQVSKNAAATVPAQATDMGDAQQLPPETRPLRENFCGFFASLPSREAAGCTSEVNEAEYHDFTSYFFAALSGQDRMGRPATGADYNHDGRIGMDEAFAYTLIHDVSIDTPVCTSDAYLRAVVQKPDTETFQTPYSSVLGWSTPAQAAVLRALATRLHLSGDGALQQAYTAMIKRTNSEEEESEDEDTEEETALWIRFVRTAKSVVLKHQLLTTGPKDRQEEFLRLEKREEAGLPLHAS